MPPSDTHATMPPFSAVEQQLRQHFSGRRVLVVEDNALNQRVTIDILKRVNLHSTIAPNGAVAIETLQNDAHYELILMDVQMPVMDGLQATRIIRTMPQVKHLPILAMTAHDQIHDVSTCLGAGMSDYLSKPILPELLLEKILYWLRQKSTAAASATRQSAPTTPATASPLDQFAWINLRIARSICGDNPAIYREYLSMYHDLHAQDVTKLRHALAQQNYPEISRLAHTLKGASLMIGIDPLVSTCTQLTQSSQASPPDPDTLHRLIQTIDSELTRIAQDLAAWPP
ncbi:response regulator [Thiorhodospira sibirica]|uniref:response regulator n=1 Tax=Thiorhodospira sibirica TaxID=154347 RepID=UPI00022C11B3|nr:response regulator [Thiorhodospira sibirica]